MYSLRPHRNFNFAKYWKLGFKISGVMIALALIGFIASTVVTGSPLTLGTEFSGGTSIQINDAGDVTEDELRDAFMSAAGSLGYDTQISSIQTATTMAGGNGYIVKTTDTVSTNASEIMSYVENALGFDESTVEIETIGASWGASVIWSSIIAFLLSCVGILVIIALRYREPRMGVVALICLFHDMIIVLGIYAWAGMFFHMEITSDVIAALLAIIGYSLYDTVVVFHRINRNASPQMKCSLKTCANKSLNEVIVRSINTSITSILPVFIMLVLGTDTLLAFAFAMFIGMIVGFYSTLAISAPIYTMWKAKEPAYKRLEEKYPYEVVQSPYTKEMMLEDRKKTIAELKERKAEDKKAKDEKRKADHEAREADRNAKRAKEEKKREEKRYSAAAAQAEADMISLDSEAEDTSVPELFNSDPNTEVDFDDLVAEADSPKLADGSAESSDEVESPSSEEEGSTVEAEPVTSSISISYSVDPDDEESDARVEVEETLDESSRNEKDSDDDAGDLSPLDDEDGSEQEKTLGSDERDETADEDSEEDAEQGD